DVPAPAIITAPSVERSLAPSPPSAREHELFFAGPEDPEPEIRGGIAKALEDVSYVVGNEWSLDAFLPSIADLGGGYVGVGPDQAYLFIGWQRPEYAWLVDYDSKVMRVHAMYRVLITAAESPRELLAMFEPEAASRTAALLGAAPGGEKLRRLYRNNRDMFRWRLVTVQRKLAKRGVASWLSDDEMFGFVRQMVMNERVRPMRVNLNDAAGMRGIAEAATALEVPIRVLYLSNAEEYWQEYEPQFRANLAALPHDERSLLLRTTLVWDINRDYIYTAQPFDNFLGWLADPAVHRIEDLIGKKPKADRGRINFVRFDAPPPSAAH
ncbi:MAG: hypothetical protein IAG13_32710, partial [Deltaproteobacteria bacterium]|nr:hypothetical protein [Nannocystaceae bacterium]